jgi:hypothetical protein
MPHLFSLIEAKFSSLYCWKDPFTALKHQITLFTMLRWGIENFELPQTQISRSFIYLIKTPRWSNFDRQNPKMGVFLQSTEATLADMVLNQSLPPKIPLRTPCSWPPWPWFSGGRFSKFCRKKKNFDHHFKNLHLARKRV